jgi:phosphoglycolate phosphatase-like HAD superfamily hydrolase
MIMCDIFSKYKYIFWDFDGVIKDSVKVKSIAFMKLFELFGQDVAIKVRKHHEANGGMSRYDKLPLYLQWSGQEPTDNMVKVYSENFSKLVKQNVINSKWVPGVLEYLDKQYDKHDFFLVTATPQLEIEEILSSLNIKHFFNQTIGAPIAKSEAIGNLLNEYSITPENSVMIGDSNSDYNAAKLNNISFILRRTNINKTLQRQLDCPMIDNFL